jgi:hypothetical protein
VRLQPPGHIERDFFLRDDVLGDAAAIMSAVAGIDYDSGKRNRRPGLNCRRGSRVIRFRPMTFFVV